MKIFLSHRSRDKPLVNEFKTLLPPFLSTWLDDDDLIWGDGLTSTLRSAIKSEVDFVIIFLDKDSLTSSWVRQELDWAHQREQEWERTFLLPVLLPDAEPARLPNDLSNRLFLRLSDFGRGSIESLATRASEQLFKLVAESYASTSLQKTPRIPHFWSPFTSPKCQFVLGRFHQFKDFEQSGFLGVGDAFALAEMQGYLKRFGFGDFQLSYADRIDGDALNNDLILIGGPDGNSVTRDVVRRSGTPLSFGEPEDHQTFMIDTADKNEFHPRFEDSEIKEEYGVIIRTDNPFNPSRKALVVFGCFGYGTWAASRFACSADFLESKLTSDDRPVECIVKANIVRDTPIGIHSVLFRRLVSFSN